MIDEKEAMITKKSQANSSVFSLDMEWTLALPLTKLEIVTVEKVLGRRQWVQI